MRHQVKGFKLGRTQAHRKATLSALSTALITHKRITTTIVKAKALRMFVEPIINRAKDDSTASRRQAFRRLGNKEAVKELFDTVAGKIGDRPGGYTRIVKIGQRPGDGTEMAVIELVDFNETGDQTTTKTRTRRTRRGRAGSGAATGTATKAAESKPKQPKADKSEAAEEQPEAPAPPADETVAPMDPEAPEKTSEASAQAPGTPLDAPEDTAGGPATDPETGIEGEGQQNQLR